MPLAILGAGVAAFYGLSQKPERAESDRPNEREILTRVTDLHVQDYPVIVRTQGIVQAHNEITLSTQVSGQITHISPNFDIGSHFSKGDVLIKLDARDYEHDVAIAEAALSAEKSDLAIAEAEFISFQRLYERKFSSEAELNRYAAARAQAESNLESAVAELAQARLNLERTTVRAPFDGRVREKTVGMGQSIGSGAALGVIFAVDFAEVRLPIAARERRFLRLPETEGAPPVPVELRDAIHPDSESTWNAQLVRTEGILDEDSLELVAIARINDPFGLHSEYPPLRIGQPVTGYIQGEILTDVIAIPRPAVRELNQIVLVNESDLRLTKVTVTPVWSDEDHIVVPNSDLFDGMVLATTHIVYAPEGARVTIIPPVSDTESIEPEYLEAGG